MQCRHKTKFFDASDQLSDYQSKSITPSTFINSSNSNRSILGLGGLLHSKSTYFYRLGNYHTSVLSTFAFLALLVGIGIIPIVRPQEVYADTMPSVSLTIDNSSQPATTVKVGEVTYRENTFTVNGSGSNNSYYSVALSAARNSLPLHGKENPSAILGGVGRDVAADDFADDTFGYAVAGVDIGESGYKDLRYNTVPEYGVNHYIVSGEPMSTIESDGSKYKLIFAAKFGKGMPSDHYVGQVLLSVVGMTTEDVVDAFDGIDSMQEMTKTICASAPENGSKQLVDDRDQKRYWVTKLKDGNCWMTQNLDYDIVSGDSASAGNNKIYRVVALNGQNASCDSVDSILSYCDGWKAFRNVLVYYDPGDVGGANQHERYGNYYSWYALSKANKDTNSGFCPKGWNLPTSNEFIALINTHYEISNDAIGAEAIQKRPLYFAAAGMISTNSTLLPVGYGRYWTSTIDGSAGKVSVLYFNNDSVGMTTEGYYDMGLSARCLFRGE